MLMLSVHPSRRHDLLSNFEMNFAPVIVSRDYVDVFGNVCTRLTAPAGPPRISSRFVISDSGNHDEIAHSAKQWKIDALPDDALVYLIGSRYCDT